MMLTHSPFNLLNFMGKCLKRYEYWSMEGKVWSEWFDYDGEQFPWQLKNKLRNEYKDE